jgi:TfoX/Sxy family transcriptional regulator of competence genes
MSTTKDYVEYILDQTGRAENIRTRAMFGEYALYYNDVVVALICDNCVYVKINEYTTPLLDSNTKTGPAYPGSKDFHILDDDVLEDKELFLKLLKECSRAKKKKS